MLVILVGPGLNKKEELINAEFTPTKLSSKKYNQIYLRCWHPSLIKFTHDSQLSNTDSGHSIIIR